MKLSPHRITYLTPAGYIRTNILIEAEDREKAENEFRREYEGFEVVTEASTLYSEP